MSVAQLTRPLGPVAHGVIAAALAASAASFVPDADARITSIVLSNTSPAPAFGGATFGTVGQSELITGVANGEVDPLDLLDALIEDIGHAPLSSNGRVAYSTQLVILRPVDLSHATRPCCSRSSAAETF